MSSSHDGRQVPAGSYTLRRGQEKGAREQGEQELGTLVVYDEVSGFSSAPWTFTPFSEQIQGLRRPAARAELLPVEFIRGADDPLMAPAPVLLIPDTNALTNGAVLQALQLRGRAATTVAVPDQVYMEIQKHSERGPALTPVKLAAWWTLEELRSRQVSLQFLRPADALVRYFGSDYGALSGDDNDADGNDESPGVAHTAVRDRLLLEALRATRLQHSNAVAVFLTSDARLAAQARLEGFMVTLFSPARWTEGRPLMSPFLNPYTLGTFEVAVETFLSSVFYDCPGRNLQLVRGAGGDSLVMSISDAQRMHRHRYQHGTRLPSLRPERPRPQVDAAAYTTQVLAPANADQASAAAQTDTVSLRLSHVLGTPMENEAHVAPTETPPQPEAHMARTEASPQPEAHMARTEVSPPPNVSARSLTEPAVREHHLASVRAPLSAPSPAALLRALQDVGKQESSTSSYLVALGWRDAKGTWSARGGEVRDQLRDAASPVAIATWALSVASEFVHLAPLAELLSAIQRGCRSDQDLASVLGRTVNQVRSEAILLQAVGKVVRLDGKTWAVNAATAAATLVLRECEAAGAGARLGDIVRTLANRDVAIGWPDLILSVASLLDDGRIVGGSDVQVAPTHVVVLARVDGGRVDAVAVDVSNTSLLPPPVRTQVLSARL